MCYQSWKNVLSWDDSCRLFVCVALSDLSSDAVKMQKVFWCSSSFSSWSCKGQNGYNDQSSEVKSNMFKYFGLVQATSEVQSCDHSQQPKHAPPHLCIRFFFWAEKIAAHTCFGSIVHHLVLESFTKQRREWMENHFEMNLIVVVKEFKCLWNIVWLRALTLLLFSDNRVKVPDFPCVCVRAWKPTVSLHIQRFKLPLKISSNCRSEF